jgi:hypothetical protein
MGPHETNIGYPRELHMTDNAVTRTPSSPPVVSSSPGERQWPQSL